MGRKISRPNKIKSILKTLIFIFTIFLTVMGCQKEEDTIETWWVNSSKKDCTGVGPMSCLQIQKGQSIDPNAWEFFYGKIEGFEYEAGNIYQLKVNVTPKEKPVPADASSLNYELVSIISKEMDKKLRLTNIWKVVKAGSLEKPVNPKSKESLVFEINASEMSYFGDLGCNTVRGKIQDLDESNLVLGPGASTKMACMDMSSENAILQAISKIKSYQIADNQLTLFDENGAEVMLLQAVD